MSAKKSLSSGFQTLLTCLITFYVAFLCSLVWCSSGWYRKLVWWLHHEAFEAADTRCRRHLPDRCRGQHRGAAHYDVYTLSPSTPRQPWSATHAARVGFFPWWRHQMEKFSALIHRLPVNSPHKGQWRGTLMFSLICAWINGWVNNREAGYIRRHPAHYDVTVMIRWNVPALNL